MKISQLLIRIDILMVLFFVFSACSGNEGGNSGGSVSNALPYCSSVTNYSNPIVVSGSAQYEYRINGNGAVASPNPIRYAEVRVVDSEGTLIQCGETDSAGNFSLNLPQSGDSATITIASRANNSFLRASIYNNPNSNSFYGLTRSVTLSSTQNVGAMIATATGTIIPGGAFNILDKLLDANDFLRINTANCAATFSNCPEFTTAPLVNVYWSAGVDPATYFGIGAPLSFYLPNENQLYILGGSGGDVDNSDTDHFDSSIILHEYGHALENLMSFTDSPGGMHNGDNILDPRLAWSEGFANFFQAAVTGNSVYRDTFGTPLGTNGVYINESLETGTTDLPSEPEEGNFREFSVSRALIDIIDSDESNAIDDLQASFSEVWTVFASTNGGFADSSYAFRSLGLFYVLQNALVGKSDWSTIQSAENQLAARTNYANSLSNGTGCPTTLLAEDVPGASPLNNPGRQPEDGSFVNSNQFKSNDFYHISHIGGALSIAMSYTTTGAGSMAADLDMYLWTDEYIFGSSAATSIAGFSEGSISPSANSGSEFINLSSLPAGDYLLNIKYDTTNGIRSAANYSLTINSQSKCPD